MAAIAPEPVFSGNTGLSDGRLRRRAGVRVDAAEAHLEALEAAFEPEPRAVLVAHPSPAPVGDGGAGFAAAVIAGGLPQGNRSPRELLDSVGLPDLLPEFEARLRDIIV